jgi:hypothetical protein
MRCCQIHRQLQTFQQQQQQQQQQQGLRLSQQLGRRMRGDLLLLPDPAQGQLLQQLLPGRAVLTAHERFQAQEDEPPEEWCMQLLRSAVSMASMLKLHIESTRRPLESPVLSAAALQLSAELLLRAAAHWQRQYMLLPVSTHALLQQIPVILFATKPEGATKARQARRDQLSSSNCALVACCRLLQQQMRRLWASGQWQPQLQLLQQGGGQVLLQGLTLVVQCGRLDAEIRAEDGTWLGDLLRLVDPELGEQGYSADAEPC